MDKPTLIISGASRGLGAATARLAASIGANVVLTARSEVDLVAVVQAITAAGGEALAVPGNVIRAADCARIVAAAMERFGSVDGLINNAGLVEPIASLAEVEPAQWEALLRVNLTGPLLLAQAALPHLRAAHGRIMNVSSGAGQNPRAAWGAYCTSKAALNMLTRVLALEEPEVTTIAFRPGATDTPMQAVIRERGKDRMREADHARFVGLYERGELFPPEQPGRALAVLALHADPAWSGEILHWQDQQVVALVARVAPTERN
jgi:NAD(P)-dependent dehydrogenase (short-subunit alcohol dehydrogenase family)